jgi:hypothetical protein
MHFLGCPVHRLGKTRLLVLGALPVDIRPGELRTGNDPADPGYINALAVQVASQYGHEVATIIDSRVTCRVLYVAFDGSHMWSDATTARPRRAS